MTRRMPGPTLSATLCSSKYIGEYEANAVKYEAVHAVPRRVLHHDHAPNALSTLCAP